MMNRLKTALLLITLGVLAFGTAPVLLTVGSYIYFQSMDVILLGVSVGTVDVGGSTRDSAARLIHDGLNEQLEILLIEVPSAERSWSVKPAVLGINVDASASAEAAFRIGREGNLGQQIWTMLDVLRNGYRVEPELTFSADKAEDAVQSWVRILQEEPVDAWIDLSGASLEVHQAQPGLGVDARRTLETLADSYQSVLLEDGWLPIFTFQTDPSRDDVRAEADEIEALLARPPVIRAYDPVTDEHFSWSPDRSTVLEWLTISDDGVSIAISIDPARIEAYIDDLNLFLGSERYLDRPALLENLLGGWGADWGQEHIIHYYPSDYIVQPGDTLISISFKVHMPYWKLHAVNPTLVTHGLSSGQKLQVPPKDDLLTLPVIPAKRVVISILEQRMWVYENGKLKWEHVISTGIPDSPTMPGIFQISSHYENAYASIWDLYMPHFMGIYDAVPGLTNGIHGLPVLSNGRRLWANVLGSPASYGCIILDLQAAEDLFYWAEEGVVVEIRE